MESCWFGEFSNVTMLLCYLCFWTEEEGGGYGGGGWGLPVPEVLPKSPLEDGGTEKKTCFDEAGSMILLCAFINLMTLKSY